MEFTYKALVVDDEKPAHLVIKSHSEKCSGIVISDNAFNGLQALQLLKDNEYDIVFLDIEMPLISGIELLETMINKPATIITSAYSNFAFAAYQNDAVDYLLKPISFPKFLRAIDKAKSFCKTRDEKKNDSKSLTIKYDGAKLILKLEDIIFVQSLGNYIKIIEKSKPNGYVVYDTLKNIIRDLPANQFVQIHKSYIINNNCVKYKSIVSVTLINDLILPVGRKYSLQLNNLILKD
jgi:two-component system, LytTR family, response regulator